MLSKAGDISVQQLYQEGKNCVCVFCPRIQRELVGAGPEQRWYSIKLFTMHPFTIKVLENIEI